MRIQVLLQGLLENGPPEGHGGEWAFVTMEAAVNRVYELRRPRDQTLWPTFTVSPPITHPLSPLKVWCVQFEPDNGQEEVYESESGSLDFPAAVLSCLQLANVAGVFAVEIAEGKP